MSIMRKWEEEKVRNNHYAKIKNVKSVLNNTLKSSHSQKSRQNKSQERDKKSTNKSRLSISNIQKYPLYNLLKSFNLQQYTASFIEMGYGENLLKFINIGDKKKQELINYVKPSPEHRMKLQTLINYISILMDNIYEFEGGSSRRTITKLPKITESKKAITKNFVQINKKSIHIKRTPKTRPPLPKKHQDSSPYSAQSINKFSQSKVSAFAYDRRSLFRSTNDDITITHKFFNGKQQPVLQENKIMMNLKKKLQLLNATKSTGIELQMDKIKTMYLSFDSATLTSNIANLDIEELCFCFSRQILELVLKSVTKRTDNIESQKSKSLYQFSNILPTTLSKPEICHTPPKKQPQPLKSQTQKQIKQDLDIIEQYMQEGFESILEQKKEFISDLLKVSLMHIRQEESNPVQQAESEESSAIESGFEEESLIQDIDQNQKKAKRFKEFNNKSKDQIYNQIPSMETILNYMKNIIISAKMEKQAPIIGMVYVFKLLNAAKQQITLYNWRNIVFICLVVASKIWDDTSLENHSISQVITTHTTIEINHLQKIMLEFIDYKLTIDQRQYSDVYFKLRKHIKDSKKSVSLRPLNLEAIRRLQNNVKKMEFQLKEKYKKNLNKSF